MIIAIASGKGGTGKTTVATNLALVAPRAQYVDCDVEEPNGHLFLKPQIESDQPVELPLPQIDESLCSHCGTCASACEFNALAVVSERVMLFAELCHGCGACTYVCPEQAINEGKREIGRSQSGLAATPSGQTLAFLQGISQIGNPLTPPIIKRVKKLIQPDLFTILDAPPGTSCPMVQSLMGCDYCVLVTEPTPFGLNDLELAVGVCRQLEIPCGIVINRADSGDERIQDYCEREQLPILLTIPFNRQLAFAYSKGEAAIAVSAELWQAFHNLYERIVTEVNS